VKTILFHPNFLPQITISALDSVLFFNRLNKKSTKFRRLDALLSHNNNLYTMINLILLVSAIITAIVGMLNFLINSQRYLKGKDIEGD